MHVGQVLRVGKEVQWAFKAKGKTRKAMAGLEAPVLHFYCRVWAFELPGRWGSKPETLKAQLWEGMRGRSHVRATWPRCADPSVL